MNKKQKHILMAAAFFALTFGIMPAVNAMHIMEGYLPGGFCIAWGALCIPFLAAGFLSIKKTLNEHRNLITLLAVSGAFIFVISSLKIPSVTGSCSHMTGTGLGSRICSWLNRTSVPGASSGARRSDYDWSKYVFYGDRRTVCVIWNL